MINVYREKKVEFAMEDFMHHLKGLVASVGEEMHSMGVENPNESPSYVDLQEFLGMEEDWRLKHNHCLFEGTWKKRKNEREKSKG